MGIERSLGRWQQIQSAAPKLTIIAPQLFRKSRRDGVMLFGLGIFSDRSQHASVRETAAQDASEGVADLLVRGIRVYIENSLRRQDHAAEAKSALGRSFVDERLLNWVRLFRGAQTFERRNLVSPTALPASRKIARPGRA